MKGRERTELLPRSANSGQDQTPDDCGRRMSIDGSARGALAFQLSKMADYKERDSYYSQTDLRSKNDDPPNSRLFVICHKSLEEDDLRKAFEKFGKIEDIWVVKDRNTGENKGNISLVHMKI